MLGNFWKRTWAFFFFHCVGFTLAPELQPAVALAWQFCRWHWTDSVSSEVHEMLLQLLSIQSQVPGESLRTDSPASCLSSSPSHLFKSGGYLIIRCCEHALHIQKQDRAFLFFKKITIQFFLLFQVHVKVSVTIKPERWKVWFCFIVFWKFDTSYKLQKTVGHKVNVKPRCFGQRACSSL